MIDIVQRLEALHNQVAYDAAEIIKQLRQQLFACAEEAQIWKERYEAERRDHEATMKAWDEDEKRRQF
jgi:hypothetical protein